MEDTLKYAYAPGKARPAKSRDAGKRLRLLRKKFGLSQEEMSEKFRISMRCLSLLETGRKIPDGPLLAAIESVLMVDRRWLLTGKGEMLASPNSASNKTIDENTAVVELLRGYKTLSLKDKRKLLMVLKMLAPAQRKNHSA
ncbi:MAG: helix-turn-helix transcriptional regulator [Deltaproteobacteria bacterium]